MLGHACEYYTPLRLLRAGVLFRVVRGEAVVCARASVQVSVRHSGGVECTLRTTHERDFDALKDGVAVVVLHLHLR